MKTIFFIIFLILAMSLKAQIQSVYYPTASSKLWSCDSLKVPQTDSVFTIAAIGNIASYNCTYEFDLTRLDGTITLDFGGGNTKISTSPVVYSFNAFQNDSLPYLISNTAYRDTINGIPQNKKSFQIIQSYDFPYPAIRITKGTCTAGKWLLFNIKCHH